MNSGEKQQLIIIVENGDITKLLMSKDLYPTLSVVVVDVDMKIIMGTPKAYVPKRIQIFDSYLVELFGEFEFLKKITELILRNTPSTSGRTKKVLTFEKGIPGASYPSILEATKETGIPRSCIRQSSLSGLPYKGVQFYIL